ncbi:MAG: STAS domain-containing protein [Actinobacteria bacterium]|nr:STAS domain-containing protein [Actinomycetota bacterium]
MARPDETTTVETDPAQGLATIRGPLELATANDVRAQVVVFIDALRARELRLDLSGVDFIDSRGLGALLRIRQSAEARGMAVSVTHASAAVRDLLDRTGLGGSFGIG